MNKFASRGFRSLRVARADQDGKWQLVGVLPLFIGIDTHALSVPVRAAEAIAVFCYQVKKWLGVFAAALGGLDTVVFAGGLGEHAPAIRARSCTGLEFVGIELDEARNAANASVISAPASRVAVRVIHTDEERVSAEAVCGVLDLGPIRRVDS